MKTKENRPTRVAILICACVSAVWNVFGLGSDYPNDRPVNEPSWPAGMSRLVNTTNRIGGLFVNAEDMFFFAGTASNFNTFLTEYSTVKLIEKHRLILHDGAGEAYSLGGGNKRPCDWELDGCPAAWRDLHEGMSKNPPNTNYVLEVHFWTGGNIALEQLILPLNVEFAGDCLKNFESITNGMTRADVERKLTRDGGLQSVSPVRFIDRGCPQFKIKVEFGFKHDPRDQSRAIESEDDRVIHVSTPYLEKPFMD